MTLATQRFGSSVMEGSAWVIVKTESGAHLAPHYFFLCAMPASRVPVSHPSNRFVDAFSGLIVNEDELVNTIR